jgi:acyl-CoA reductase-like NAD-dependent aldehyde dehydrogenase
VLCAASYWKEKSGGIANDSPYGLAGGVWSSDLDRALGDARRVRTGQVDVNGGSFNPVPLSVVTSIRAMDASSEQLA